MCLEQETGVRSDWSASRRREGAYEVPGRLGVMICAGGTQELVSHSDDKMLGAINKRLT